MSTPPSRAIRNASPAFRFETVLCGTHLRRLAQSRDCNQQAGTDAYGPLTATPEFVFVARFEKPTESMLGGRPEHEIHYHLPGDRVRCYTALPGMNPLRANAKHELHLLRERPGLFEKQVGAPFYGVAAEERRRASLKFQPFLDRRNFDGEIGSAARFGIFEIPASGPAKLQNRRRLGIRRLGDGASVNEKQEYQRQETGGLHSMECSSFYSIHPPPSTRSPS